MMMPSERAAAKGARDMPEGRALVLGGGGVAGIAWMTGLLAGLAESGTDLTGADLLIGTSAGANVAAQVGSGLPLADLYARQADPARQAREIAAELDIEKLGADFVTVMGEAESAREIQRRMAPGRWPPTRCRNRSGGRWWRAGFRRTTGRSARSAWWRWRRAPARRRCSTGTPG
jgi:predicted acylesterase/phospholipase RssA